jgi:KipI family sensor histidine kinase inhibitor
MRPLRIFRAHSKWIEISWPKKISAEILQEQLAVREFLEKEYSEGIKEIRMGFNTLSLKLSIPISPSDTEELLEEIKTITVPPSSEVSKYWEIPVCYAPNFGKDLGKLASIHGIAEEEIVLLHSKKEYVLHFYGFLPGFMYLGGLDERLVTPRKKTPDRFMPAGTVAIGGQQTGIYPMDSPAGWYAIGRTPWKIFDIKKSQEQMPKIGDTIRFMPITLDEFSEIKEKTQTPI